MDLTQISAWRTEFARSATWQREQKTLHHLRNREDREKRERDADKGDDAIADLANAVLATPQDVADFRVELDAYDTATVEALMQNEQDLKAVRDQLDDMLDKAYVLEDGRRVFKAEDGMRVFDEHGVELSTDAIDPGLVEDWRPKAEDYLEANDLEKALVEERTEILDFQEKVDHAREESNRGDMTKQELDDLRSDLEANAPPAVKRHMDGYEESQPAPASTAFNAVAPQPVQFAAKPLAPEFVQ